MKKIVLMVWLCLMMPSIIHSYDKLFCKTSDKPAIFRKPTSPNLMCHEILASRCYCSTACFEGIYQFVVNCTDTNFSDTSVLRYLPPQTEVLIFTGNNLKTLTWNIFGTSDENDNSLSKLKVIDMSRNKIREIKGKSFHHVSNVQRLILDFNDLSVSSENDHPRIFSNFESLLELHLTDAFEESPEPRDLAEALHNIFYNSNLTKLMKLHIEQNEISEFHDENVFCDLQNLLDLHLGDNLLTGLHFNLSCLHKLRFLDLQRNKFTKVMERDLQTLDEFSKHQQNVTIDLLDNPLECSCQLNPFIKWMNKTKIFVRNKDNLKCTERGITSRIQEVKNCAKVGSLLTVHGATVAISILSVILAFLVCALIYLQRDDLKKKLTPVIVSVNKRVRYSSIDTADDV